MISTRQEAPFSISSIKASAKSSDLASDEPEICQETLPAPIYSPHDFKPRLSQLDHSMCAFRSRPETYIEIDLYNSINIIYIHVLILSILSPQPDKPRSPFDQLEWIRSYTIRLNLLDLIKYVRILIEIPDPKP